MVYNTAILGMIDWIGLLPVKIRVVMIFSPSIHKAAELLGSLWGQVCCQDLRGKG